MKTAWRRKEQVETILILRIEKEKVDIGKLRKKIENEVSEQSHKYFKIIQRAPKFKSTIGSLSSI